MKRLRRLILAALCIALLTVSVFADVAQVDNMQVALSVDQNGTARAETTLHVILGEPLDTFSIGLGSEVSGVHVDGYGAHVSHVGDQTTVVLQSTETLPSSMDLHISYTIRNTVQSASDIQHFSVRLLGGLPDADIQKLTATVQMPAPFEAIPEFSSGYYAEGIDNYLTIDVDEEGKLTATNTETMLAGETLDLKLDTPLDYFTLHNVAGRTLTVDRILMGVLALFATIFWWRRVRYPLPALGAQTQAPMGAEPGTAAMLLVGAAPDLPLAVMNWGAHGYLRVTRLRGHKVVLQRLMPMGNERSPYEQSVFARLFADSPEVVCGSKAWSAAGKKLNKLAPRYWNPRLYEKAAGKPAVLRAAAVLFCGVAALSYADTVLPSMYTRILLLVVFTVVGLIWGAVLQYALRRLPMRRRRTPVILLALCIAAMVVGWRITGHAGVLLLAFLFSVLIAVLLLFGSKRKQSGVNLLGELLSWRRQLRSLTRDDAQQLLGSDPQYYYNTLLFAEALGVGRKFSRAFAGIKLDECAFIEREDKGLPRMAEKYRPVFLSTLAIVRGEAKKAKKKPAKPAKSKKSASKAGAAPAQHRTRDIRDFDLADE